MEGLVKLSFYSFTAASIALGAALVCYVVYAAGRIRLRQASLATSTGTTMTTTTAEFAPGPAAAGRFGTLLAWFALVFQGLAVLLRTIAAGRGPYSNMYEFSLAFIFAVLLVYLVFERLYEIKQLGPIVLAVAFGMSLYVWSLPTRMREVEGLNPALQNQPLMTVHVSTAILAYATFAVAFAAAVLYLIASRRQTRWLPSPDMLDDIGYRAVTIGFPMLALVRSAMTNEQVATMLRQFIAATLLGPLAERFGIAPIRMEAAAGQLVGVAMLRYVLGLEPIASATAQELVELLAPALQRHFDGD